jgi:hypothetical protein
MRDVWSRLINVFFEFRDAKGYYTREYGHYRDRVASSNDPPRSIWYLHENKIAVLEKTENGLYVLKLTNAGYDTLTTISRLNLIVHEAYKRFIHDDDDTPLFRLKYHHLGSTPITTYVEYQGKTYLLTGREVKIIFFPEQKRADVDIYGREILFFKDRHEPEIDRKLRIVKRLHWEINSLLEKIKDVSDEIGNLAERKFGDILGLLNSMGLEYYGMFEDCMKEPDYTLIVDTLRNVRNALKLIYNEDPEKMRASLMMVE